MTMYIGEPFSWKPAAFEGSNGIMSVTTKETTAHGRIVYINEAHRYFTAEADFLWETMNGKGSCLWASEIEEFPIAVTKHHFPDEEKEKQGD